MFLRLTAQDDELAKLSRYECKLLERKLAGLVLAALANKTARIARAVLARDQSSVAPAM